MATYLQTSRPLAIDSVLGADKLLLTGLYGEESVSSLARFSLELLSDDPQIPAERMLGSAVSIRLEAGPRSTRWFHGVISEFAQGDKTGGSTAYTAEMVSWPWLLSLHTDCRIFQELTVPEIVERVFQAREQSDFELRLSATYSKREFCVQYNETDLAFVMRLLEDEGIAFFFEHTQQKHTLVLVDHPTKLRAAPLADSIHMARAGSGWDAMDVVMALRSDHRLQPGKATLTDYDMTKPTSQLLQSVGSGRGDVYGYPGGYKAHEGGEKRARLRLEEREAARHVVHGESTCRGLAAGMLTEIGGHYRRSLNGKYHVTSVRHSIRQGGFGGEDEGAFEYRNEFLAIPHAVPFRPPRVTPLPRVHGAQTATVVGKQGEEIWTDKYGRVKVHFHWDRVGKKDEEASCWIRVATPWAGKGWGLVHVPRMGQEVIVEFLEGDPSQPIIVGSLWNGEQMPPWTLPDNGTISGLRSRSSKGGGGENELVFEDRKDKELITLHAEKDLTVEVENDERRTVEHDRTTTITNDDTRTVTDGNDATTVSKGDQTLKIAAGKQTVTIKGDQAVTLEQGNASLTVKMGNQTTKVELGKSTMEAMQSIELKVGQSSIVIDQSGVKIKGMTVKVEGQIAAEMKGTMAKVSGDAMLTLKGGVTMIN